MGDELKEIARMYGELFGKAADLEGNQVVGSYTEIVRKDLFHSLHVIAKRLLELEKAVKAIERPPLNCVGMVDDAEENTIAAVRLIPGRK